MVANLLQRTGGELSEVIPFPCPVESLSALVDPLDGPRRSHSPLNISDKVVPSARTILLSVRKPGSRVPRSKSEM